MEERLQYFELCKKPIILERLQDHSVYFMEEIISPLQKKHIMPDRHCYNTRQPLAMINKWDIKNSIGMMTEAMAESIDEPCIYFSRKIL